MPLFATFRRAHSCPGPRFVHSVVVVGALLALPGVASADAVDDAGRLIKQGKFAQAQEVLDKALAQKPGDPQARFLKGIALTELGKTDGAIAVFQKLTEEYPTLPEPYNNLAVIYAQQKQYDKAKAALETAIRTHPAYATAHENLGDIYARLATQAYDKALQLDSSNASAQQKLALIRDLTGTPARIGKTAEPSKPTVVAVAPTPPTVAPPVASPPVVATPPAAVTPAPTMTVPATPPVAAKPTPTNPAEPAVKPATDSKVEHKAVASAIEAWAAAWSRKDVRAYLAGYARDFKVPGGKSRNAWETERRQRIDKPGSIDVSVSNLKISVDGDRAVANFRQSYRSGKLDVSTSKRLDLVNRDNRWLIVQESVGG